MLSQKHMLLTTRKEMWLLPPGGSCYNRYMAERRFRFSFQMVIAGIFIPLITCIVIITGVVTLSMVENNQRNIIGANTQSVLRLTDGYFSSRLSDAVASMIAIYNSSVLSAVLDSISQSSSLSPSSYLQLQNLLDNAFDSNYSMVSAVGIAFEDSPSFLYKSYQHVKAIDYDWQRMRDMTKGTFRLVWRCVGNNSCFSYSGNDENSAGICIEGVSQKGAGFVICLDIREDFIKSSFANLLVSSPSALIVKDSEGYVNLIEPTLDDPAGLIQKLKGIGQLSGTIRFDDVFAVYDSIPINDWSVIVAFDDSELFESLAPIRNVIVLMAILIGVLAVLLAVLFSVIISRPVRSLASEVARIDVDDIANATLSQTDSHFYEVSILRENTSSLLKRINQLIQDIEQRQQENLRMQNSLLLSQINPHFLYNMLYSIAQECRMGETEEASEMLYELSSFFRLGLNSGREVVSLSDEKEHVQNYLRLISRSFPYGLDWDVSIPPGLMDMKMPRMTLQPIAENCFKHGLRNRRSRGIIKISADKQDDALLITVSDNGIGITPDKLRSINETILTGKHSVGFGIYNVSVRLRNYFGKGSTVSIKSEPGKGTEVTILIRYDKENSNEH